MPHGRVCPCDNCLSIRQRMEQIEVYKRFGLIVLAFAGIFVATFAFLAIAFSR